MRRMLAVARKEFIHMTRDRRLLAMIIIFPLVQLFLFAYAVSFDVKNVPTAVFDQDHSPVSREYVDALQQSNYFRVEQRLTSWSQVDAEFTEEKSRVVVIIAPGFGSEIAAGRPGPVQILIDGSEPNAAQVAQNHSNALSRAFSARITVARAESRGQVSGGASGGNSGGPSGGAGASAQASVGPGSLGPPQLTSASRIWYNPDGGSADFFVPGLIVIILTMVTIQQTANALVREKEQGTFEQLIVSPITRIELVAGKIAPWAAVAALEVILVSVIGIIAFDIPFRGSALLFALGSLLYVLCTLGMGLIISARASSVDTANQFAGLLAILPGFMLSGFMFPLDSMPQALQAIAAVFPAQYFMVIVRTIFLKGGGMAVLWPQFATLAGFALLFLVISARAYRERA